MEDLIMNDSVSGSADKIRYNYKFIFENGEEREFNIVLDSVFLNIIRAENKVTPVWTKLNCFKCPICTLDDRQQEYCPVAVNIADVIDAFKKFVSSESVEVIVTADARRYVKKVSLQQGVSSLIGIYMVTSGCPILEKLKPMVRFHLPFATVEETIYRSISMYLLAQYFLHRHGDQPDWELNKLADAYKTVKIVNDSFCKRLGTIGGKDAHLSAVVSLDAFAEGVNFSIDSKMVDDLDYLFEGYIK